MTNPWRDLEDLSERGWSIVVSGHEDEHGEPDGITLDAERRSFVLGEPSQRLSVIAKSVAEASPMLLRQIGGLRV